MKSDKKAMHKSVWRDRNNRETLGTAFSVSVFSLVNTDDCVQYGGMAIIGDIDQTQPTISARCKILVPMKNAYKIYKTRIETHGIHIHT